ncbi:MAG: restriction endonuclease subunit S [Dysgonamonadaceae bacterium]|nr:restriction endonuclease subunit S [Dysgonamonadaceae bacterium]MDD3309899.1 restriction endonuclease subunit S [Dysgonamonadaceae bacterium]MDD3901546.1 restriction endonuclease subunit S [Dysgonamonadaceae bacterium]MDD4399989.1 restriction endonuclease subunit S [Dysgonamonadaceae bacterium]
MQSNYKPIGEYIQLIDNRNTDLAISELLGVSINKTFIPSVANVIGSDMANYKIIRKNQFACSLMQVRRDKKIPVALYSSEQPAIISQAYPVFEIIDSNTLLPEYLMMWFSRSEFDREACFYAVGGVRGSLEWDDFCKMQLPVPSLTKQQEAVDEYNIIQRRIDLNKQLCEKLEETAQTLYRKYFVDDFDEENLPEGWRWGKLGEVAIISMGQSPIGESYNSDGLGEIFYQGRSDFGNRYPTIRMFTDEPTKIAKQGDVLLSVRAPVGDINIAPHNCCIGRGLASIRNKRKHKSYMFYLTKSLKSDFSIADSDGTIFGSINRETLININIIIPDENVVQRFEKEVLNIDRLYENINLEINKLKEILSLLLSKIGRKDKLL